MDTTNNKDIRLQLTIRMSHNSISLAVGDPKTKGKIVYDPYEMNGRISLSANLREAFDKAELLQSGYKNVLLLTDSTVMLVPKEEYVEAQAPSLYRYSFGGHEKDDIARAEIPELSTMAVFSVNRDVRIVLQDHFENINMLPVILPVWRHLYRKAFTGHRNKMFVYFHDRRMNIFRFEHARFRFANSLECSHAHDALYYILYVWKILGMDNNEDELYLVGDMPHGKWLTENIGKYLSRAFVINQTSDFGIDTAQELDKVPYDIKALYL